MTDADMIGPSRATSKLYSMTQQKKCLMLIAALRAELSFTETHGRLRLDAVPSAEAVKRIAELLVELWPRDSEPPPPIERPTAFDLLFWGHRTPNSLAVAITRASLYADHVLAVNPFVDAFTYHPENSPLVRPEIWRNEYAQQATFMVLLEPWIQADLVRVIENPACWGRDLRASLKREFRNSGFALTRADEVAGFIETVGEDLLSLPAGDHETLLAAMVRPDLRPRVREYVARTLKTDPIRAELPREPLSDQFMKSGTGVGLTHATFLSQLYSSSLFTDRETIAGLMAHLGRFTASFERLAHAFGQVKFDFLNDVPPKVALEAREEGKLSQFRDYLKGLAASPFLRTDPVELDERAIREFVERFEFEYRNYRQGWNDIKRAFLTDALLKGSAASSIIGAVSGTLKPIPLVVGGIIGLSAAIASAHNAQRAHRRHALGLVLRVEQGA
jgi:hypothetical protein